MKLTDMPAQNTKRYQAEELDKMAPEYLALVDAGKEQEATLFLKDKFDERPVDLLAFASIIAAIVDDRKKDVLKESDDANTGEPELAGATEPEAPDAGQDDIVECTSPVECDNGPDVGSDS